MIEYGPADLRERLNRDLPGAVVMPAEPQPLAESAPAQEEGKPQKGGKQEAAKVEPGHPAPTDDTIVLAERLPDVAVYLRDNLGYGLLSDIVVVDYLAAGFFELVYLFYHPDGGAHLSVKVRVPREQPDVPALTSFWPGANLMEREAFDLYGINFLGHPYLKRIYMWDELECFPMRKDFPKQGDKYLDEG